MGYIDAINLPALWLTDSAESHVSVHSQRVFFFLLSEFKLFFLVLNLSLAVSESESAGRMKGGQGFLYVVVL